MSAYVHIPFCAVRCGYCDFNTYVSDFGPGASRSTYADSVCAEIDLSKPYLAGEFQTVFFGGGTPTVLETKSLARILHDLPVAHEAEITVEANPESVTRESIFALAEAGFTRVSVGMQSAVPKILKVLDRKHRPERLPEVAKWVREAGLQFSVDLIYGIPGESLKDWETSIKSALDLYPDHISAYSLIIEPGTKMHAQVQRGQLPAPDPDDAADKYILADRLLGEAGFKWYEISNFARWEKDELNVPATKLRHASKHNLAYWQDWNWWGYGPGAHSHIGNTRWWNVKHPLAYASQINKNELPIQSGELLSPEDRRLENIMLSIRTSNGWQKAKEQMADPRLDGLVENGVLTLRGRLMADYVTRVLAGWE